MVNRTLPTRQLYGKIFLPSDGEESEPLFCLAGKVDCGHIQVGAQPISYIQPPRQSLLSQCVVKFDAFSKRTTHLIFSKDGAQKQKYKKKI